MNLKEFPMDSQQLEIQVVAVGYDNNEVIFVQNPDEPSGLADKLSVTEWAVTKWSAEALINGNCSGTVSSCQAWVMPVVFNIDIGYKTLVCAIYIINISNKYSAIDGCCSLRLWARNISITSGAYKQ
jgi:hypothetical protein